MILADLLGPFDLIVVLIVALVIFGGSKLPKIARSLGTATQEFKRGVEEGGRRPDAKPANDDHPTGEGPTA
jgi:sec-independent protein translocase protein TatA